MADICKACTEPLLLPIDPEDSDPSPSPIPDDLLLPCGCHFHWQCLLDLAPSIITNHSCPSCSTHLLATPPGGSSSSSSSAPQAISIPTRYTSEGGVEDNLDILPTLNEEAYLSQHPEARPARAMHTMVAEGDVSGLVELLMDVDNDEDVDIDATQLLRWTDPLNGGKSALHVAIEAGQEEPFWLLLWLGSGMKGEFFPEEMRQVGLPRGEVGGEDIRFIQDAEGRRPRDLLMRMGPPWSLYVEDWMFPEVA
ncbi:hypothetical protein B0T16DRAFT_417609 [Cercophora newfieldiana]|uniref:RING-type domain-containing protein n=1 Tax=Cercophora newfieldiana TaxID=92897 RepID=A0AA39Y4K8_9PEZI|nr:hypothetical protein B0T16DRAFT_417609 [Cercophora newfieldiana]